MSNTGKDPALATDTLSTAILTPEARRHMTAGDLDDARRSLLHAARNADKVHPRAHHSIMAALAAVDDARQSLILGRVV